MSKEMGQYFTERLLMWMLFQLLEQKDINDLFLAGFDIMSILKSNTYSGLEAKVKFNEWKRV